MLEALGMIEVTGYLGAIGSADAALKAANVTLLRSEKIQGGITTVELVGDVAAVAAAVDAGKMVAEKLGCFRASHVIPRMDPAVQAILLDEKQESLIKKAESEAINTGKKPVTSQAEEAEIEIIEEVIAETTIKGKEEPSAAKEATLNNDKKVTKKTKKK